VTPSTNPNLQSEWRTLAITAAGYDPRRDLTNETFNRWWFNGINQSSLRLTKQGYTWFTKNGKFTFHTIDLVARINGRQLLQLERLFSQPYYIAKINQILVIDESTAVMLQLHAGDLHTYLQNLDDNQ
jgi:hypothetical protein